MVVTEARPPIPNRPRPVLSRLTAACRAALYHYAEAPRQPGTTNPPPAVRFKSQPEPSPRPGKNAGFQALCLSAMALPGMMAAAQSGGGMVSVNPSAAGNVPAASADAGAASQTPQESFNDYRNDSEAEDEISYQYSHYEEAKRNLWDIAPGVTDNNGIFTTTGPFRYRNDLQPLTVDSEHAYTRFKLGDRVRFAFNYAQDVWSGATPWFTAAAGDYIHSGNNHSVTGATYQFNGAGSGEFFDAKGKPLYISALDTNSGAPLALAPNRIQHVMGYASPEMRNQLDFKLGYDWDNASLDVGGGASIERDYLSRFGNVAARMDFNQKRTTLNLGLSFTHSETKATLNTGESAYGGQVLDPSVSVSYIPGMSMTNGATGLTLPEEIIKGNREDGAITLALSQVLTKNAVLNAGFGYTRSSGYLSNPYKDVAVYQLDPNWRTDGWSPFNVLPATPLTGAQLAVAGGVFKEQRPNLRNQFTWDVGYRHYIEPLNAAGKLNYSFFHDDWGINAHTFEGEWRQSLPGNWTLTPHARYYTQSAATFYAPYLFTYLNADQSNFQDFSSLAHQHFSSDQRLSAYGAISGGVTLGKQLTKGLSMELGYEYYTHKGALALGSGTPDYADYHFFVANATLRANLGLLAQAGASDGYGMTDWLGSLFDPGAAPPDDPHAGHHHGHAAAPAGVMFAHMLNQAGDAMLGYRFMRSTQGGSYLHGSQPVGAAQLLDPNSGVCQPAPRCYMLSTGMTMNMHMLDLMYAPADWLTLMLMPQFMSMSMDMVMPVPMDMNAIGGGMDPSGWRTYQASGGFGDTGGYAMFKLLDTGDQHVHLTQGVSAPTGAVNVWTNFPGTSDYIYSYGMQLGSGTWDYKPSLTYTGQAGDWFWGGQVSGVHRLQGVNSYGYRLGDVFQTTAWGGYQLTHWLSATVRGIYTGQGKIVGSHLDVTSHQGMWMPEDMPGNYGGSFADIGFGFTASVPYGKLRGHTLAFEWLQPVSTNVQGYQLDRTGALAASWSYKF